MWQKSAHPAEKSVATLFLNESRLFLGSLCTELNVMASFFKSMVLGEGPIKVSAKIVSPTESSDSLN